jgi:hypothetical protein
VADVILRLIRLRWPSACFLDAEGDHAEPIDSPGVLVRGARSREFFVFASPEAAESWQRDGATPENTNTMLHFLVQEHDAADRSPRRVTMVCDALSEEMKSLADELQASFLAGITRCYDTSSS